MESHYRTDKKAWKSGSPRMKTYTLLHQTGMAIQEAYKLAGYKGKRETKAAYRAEERRCQWEDDVRCALDAGTIINPSMLEHGVAVVQKIFDDYLNDRPNANSSAAVRLVLMQQNRLNPLRRNKRTAQSGVIQRKAYFPSKPISCGVGP